MPNFVRIVSTITAVLLLAFGMLSCSGQLHQELPTPAALIDSVAQPPDSALPAFPLDRNTAALVDTQLQGSEFFEKSSGPLSSINSLFFDVTAGKSDYAIYQFNAGDDQLIKLSLDLTISAGNEAWVGLADFSRNRWQFGAPVAVNSSDFDLSGNAGYKSPAGNFYCAVVGWDGSSFTINGLTLQTDRDLFSIGGNVAENDFNLMDVTMTLTPGGTELLTDADGMYSFALLDPGVYTVSPSKPGYSFNPVSIEVTLTDADVSDANFAAQDLGLPSHSVSGNVQYMGGGLENVQLTLTPGGASILTDVNGDFSLPGIVDGNYTLTPLLADYDFAPLSIILSVSGADSTGNDFIATDVVAQTYSISGAVTVGTTNLQNVAISIMPGSHITNTDEFGAYSISGLVPDSYTVTPSKEAFLFTPPVANVDIVDADVTDVNFDAVPDNSGTFTVSGYVDGPPGGLSGAVITLQPGNFSAPSGPGGGGYSITLVPSGIYTATCTKSGWTITPFSQQVVVADGNVTGVNWFASPPL